MTTERFQPSDTVVEQSNGASIDEMIAYTRVEIPALTEEVLTALGELDATEMDENLCAEAVNIVGVFSGIKPAAELSPSLVTEQQEDIFRRMGLVYMEVSSERYGVPMGVLSRHSDLAQALGDAFNRRDTAASDAQADEVEYEIGKLLGFPETAVQYYVEQRQAGGETGVVLPLVEVDGFSGSMDYFRMFILSPGYADQEVQEYCEPLRQATEIMMPKLYRRVLDLPGRR